MGVGLANPHRNASCEPGSLLDFNTYRISMIHFKKQNPFRWGNAFPLGRASLLESSRVIPPHPLRRGLEPPIPFFYGNFPQVKAALPPSILSRHPSWPSGKTGRARIPGFAADSSRGSSLSRKLFLSKNKRWPSLWAFALR